MTTDSKPVKLNLDPSFRDNRFECWAEKHYPNAEAAFLEGALAVWTIMLPARLYCDMHDCIPGCAEGCQIYMQEKN